MTWFPAPSTPNLIVASGENALYTSWDAGQRWPRIAWDRVGLLVWPRDGALYLVDATGNVHRLRDDGET